MLGKHLTTELHPQPKNKIFKVLLICFLVDKVYMQP
jgi:hypothetical protein